MHAPAVATGAEEIPWILLSLCSQPRKDSGSSLAEVVYGTPLVLPIEFLQVEEFSVDQIVKKFSKLIDTSAFFSLPGKHNAGRLLPTLTADLFHAPLIWVRHSCAVPPLQRLYDGPYAVLHRSPCSFTPGVGT